MTKISMFAGVLLGAFVLMAGSAAKAATYNLYLTADQNASGYDLTGFDTPITVSEGDKINAYITFSSLFSISSSSDYNYYGLYLFGEDFPSVDTGTNGIVTLSNAGATVKDFYLSTTTSGQLALVAIDFAPDNARTATEIAYEFAVSNLTGETVTLDSASFQVGQVNKAPLPGAALLFGSSLTGLFGIGARRRKAAV